MTDSIHKELPQLFTTREVAERLRLTPQRVSQLVKSGRLAAFRIGDRGDFRFLAEDVLELLTKRDDRSEQTTP